MAASAHRRVASEPSTCAQRHFSQLGVVAAHGPPRPARRGRRSRRRTPHAEHGRSDEPSKPLRWPAAEPPRKGRALHTPRLPPSPAAPAATPAATRGLGLLPIPAEARRGAPRGSPLLLLRRRRRPLLNVYARSLASGVDAGSADDDSVDSDGVTRAASLLLPLVYSALTTGVIGAVSVAVGICAQFYARQKRPTDGVDPPTVPKRPDGIHSPGPGSWHDLVTAPPVLVLLGAMCAVAVFAMLLLLRRQLGGKGKKGPPRPASLPPEFMCPITGEIMREPVTTADGHVFERSAIERWLATHSTSPMTGMPLEHTKIAPAHSIRQLIERSMESGASKDE